jgi:methylmalonyl-CoA mutase C-terminal domain/subunit
MAVEKNVDILGLSILSGSHLRIVKEVTQLLKEKKIDLPIIVGGVIPDIDVPKLKALGVKEVFPPGTRLEDIISALTNIARGRQTDRTQR